VLVAINGEHRKIFSDSYRQKILTECSHYERTFPIFFPEFRGLSKLWNTVLIHSSNPAVLVLNDDALFTRGNELDLINELDMWRLTVLNCSWSHFLANRCLVNMLGWFDERLLGIGEEDGDFAYRYEAYFGYKPLQANIPGLRNFYDKTAMDCPQNIRHRDGMKYSQFNRDFVYGQKYKQGGTVRGFFDSCMELQLPCPNQYPNESFFWEHQKSL
jgi:hypothetical protein